MTEAEKAPVTPPEAAAENAGKSDGGRSDYYNKWDKFTKEEVAKVKEEEEKLKKESDEVLGKNKHPQSEAEAADIAKRAALREAKKKWDRRKELELAARHHVTGHTGGEYVLTSAAIEHKPVLLLKGNEATRYHLPNKMEHQLIKVFMEDCSDCTLVVESNLVTQHIELSHCNNVKVEVRVPVATLQADLCDTLHVTYGSNLMQQNHKLYHAGVRNLTVETKCGHSSTADYVKDLEGKTLEQGKVPEEQQFVTHFVDGQLQTEMAYRGKSNMPITMREHEESQNVDEVQSNERAAELKKIGGNEAFQEGHFAQAAIFYTEAIDLLEETKETTLPLLHIVLANRAAAFLKLGHHDKALEDADACLELNPEFVKGLFRRGLALHALGRYQEAAISLSKALDKEPKNKSIKQALTFAEAKLRKQRMEMA